MADFVIRDNSGTVIGRISEAGPGCLGCLGVSALAIIIWLGISAYHFIQARRDLSRIEAQRIALLPGTLDAYTGEYKYPRYKIRIERRGDRLFNISPEEFCELVPISSQEFIYKACANGFMGRARFERDGQGGLSLIIIYRDGRTQRAPRVN